MPTSPERYPHMPSTYILQGKDGLKNFVKIAIANYEYAKYNTSCATLKGEVCARVEVGDCRIYMSCM